MSLSSHDSSSQLWYDWEESYGTFFQSLTSATVGDILNYVRYIAGEDVKDVELPGSLFSYLYATASRC